MKGREDATGGLSLLSARGWQISSYLGSSSICSPSQMMIAISWYYYHYFNYYHYYYYLTDFLLSWVVFDLFCFSDDDNIMIWDEMMAMVMMEMVLLMVVMVFMLIFSTKKENDAQCSFWHWKWRGTEKTLCKGVEQQKAKFVSPLILWININSSSIVHLVQSPVKKS